MDKNKLCIISDTVFDLNGVSRFIQDIANEANKNNKNLTVITSTKKERNNDLENIININPIFKIKMPFYKSLDLVFPNFYKIYKTIKRINPDIVHISTPGPVGLSALISAKILGKNILGTYHTDFPKYVYKNTNSKVLEYLSKKYLQVFYFSFKRILSRSPSYCSIIAKDIKYKKENIVDFKFGIDTQKFNYLHKDEKIWENFNIRTNSFKALYVGRLSKEKNIHKLIKVWKKKHLKVMDLILIGDDELNLNKEELLKYNIHLLNRQYGSNLSKIYASSNCFIFPSTTDTLGQVVLEAMASGLPVLVTNKGGPKEFVSIKHGYIQELDDEKKWIKAVKELYFKKHIFKEKSENAILMMDQYKIKNSFADFWEKKVV